MSYTYSVEERSGVLVIAFQGMVTSYDELAEAVGEIIKESILRKCKCVLVDHRYLTLVISEEGVRDLARDVEEENLHMLHIRFACLGNPDALDMFLLFEGHHRERGLDFKAFTDEGAAMEWLRA